MDNVKTIQDIITSDNKYQIAERLRRILTSGKYIYNLWMDR